MTDERLSEIERAAAAATPGPWKCLLNDGAILCPPSEEPPIAGEVVRRIRSEDEIRRVLEEIQNDEPRIALNWCESIASYRWIGHTYDADCGEHVSDDYVYLRAADASFIALAREAVPELLSEVRRLRDRVAIVEAANATLRRALEQGHQGA